MDLFLPSFVRYVNKIHLEDNAAGNRHGKYPQNREHRPRDRKVASVGTNVHAPHWVVECSCVRACVRSLDRPTDRFLVRLCARWVDGTKMDGRRNCREDGKYGGLMRLYALSKTCCCVLYSVFCQESCRFRNRLGTDQEIHKTREKIKIDAKGSRCECILRSLQPGSRV